MGIAGVGKSPQGSGKSSRHRGGPRAGHLGGTNRHDLGRSEDLGATRRDEVRPQTGGRQMHEPTRSRGMANQDSLPRAACDIFVGHHLCIFRAASDAGNGSTSKKTPAFRPVCLNVRGDA